MLTLYRCKQKVYLTPSIVLLLLKLTVTVAQCGLWLSCREGVEQLVQAVVSEEADSIHLTSII